MSGMGESGASDTAAAVRSGGQAFNDRIVRLSRAGYGIAEYLVRKVEEW